MIVSINQPAYLPWLGYFDRIMKSDIHIVLDHVVMGKDAMCNRNRIRTPEGRQMLTVPIKARGDDTPIHAIQIAEDKKWRRKHLMAIKNNYPRAPYYAKHIPFFEWLYNNEWDSLSNLCKVSNAYFLDCWRIKAPLQYSQFMKGRGQKTELNLNLCMEAGATKYLSGQMGRDYLEVDKFTEQNIAVDFQDYQHPEYKQAFPGFVSHMSALDALFNCKEFPA